MFCLDGKITRRVRRTVAAVGRWVADGITDMEVLAGAAGAGFAAEFLGFLKIYRSLPSIDQILLDPTGAPVPKDPAALYAVGAALTRKFTRANAGRMFTYAARIWATEKAEVLFQLTKFPTVGNFASADPDSEFVEPGNHSRSSARKPPSSSCVAGTLTVPAIARRLLRFVLVIKSCPGCSARFSGTPPSGTKTS